MRRGLPQTPGRLRRPWRNCGHKVDGCDLHLRSVTAEGWQAGGGDAIIALETVPSLAPLNP